ncbi:MAG TPA: hypothetical protein PK125_04540 [Syntrophorhabdus sp.]|jgi:hypothetical protein|nr:hypothetical protein [Syntrophorhabdus sp.]HPB37410.1 hypothetical protein [Syntrophorhabdus sp.]HPW36352.1 hypothetical protein [Syntrophorhabdus sp.]HQB34500.1 hypothetical protein [Syntrophorhabdus sp.]HQO62189.1 hypothetical protein [Syntrophorhabdus sp.]
MRLQQERWLEFSPPVFEEVADPGPIIVAGAFCFSMGMTITGGEVLHSYINE